MILVTLSRYLRRVRRHKAMGPGLVATLLSISIVGNAFCFYVCDRPQQDELTLGDALWYSVITRNVRGTALFSTAVTETDAARDCKHLATELLDHDANLISVNRAEDSLTSFRGCSPPLTTA